MVLGLPIQNGECGKTILQGHTADISHIADFSMYDWCWTLSPRNSNQDRKQLARWLGPSFDVGGELCLAHSQSAGDNKIIDIAFTERRN